MSTLAHLREPVTDWDGEALSGVKAYILAKSTAIVQVEPAAPTGTSYGPVYGQLASPSGSGDVAMTVTELSSIPPFPFYFKVGAEWIQATGKSAAIPSTYNVVRGRLNTVQAAHSVNDPMYGGAIFLDDQGAALAVNPITVTGGMLELWCEVPGECDIVLSDNNHTAIMASTGAVSQPFPAQQLRQGEFAFDQRLLAHQDPDEVVISRVRGIDPADAYRGGYRQAMAGGTLQPVRTAVAALGAGANAGLFPVQVERRAGKMRFAMGPVFDPHQAISAYPRLAEYQVVTAPIDLSSYLLMHIQGHKAKETQGTNSSGTLMKAASAFVAADGTQSAAEWGTGAALAAASAIIAPSNRTHLEDFAIWMGYGTSYIGVDVNPGDVDVLLQRIIITGGSISERIESSQNDGYLAEQCHYFRAGLYGSHLTRFSDPATATMPNNITHMKCRWGYNGPTDGASANLGANVRVDAGLVNAPPNSNHGNSTGCSMHFIDSIHFGGCIIYDLYGVKALIIADDQWEMSGTDALNLSGVKDRPMVRMGQAFGTDNLRNIDCEIGVKRFHQSPDTADVAHGGAGAWSVPGVALGQDFEINFATNVTLKPLERDAANWVPNVLYPAVHFGPNTTICHALWPRHYTAQDRNTYLPGVVGDLPYLIRDEGQFNDFEPTW